MTFNMIQFFILMAAGAFGSWIIRNFKFNIFTLASGYCVGYGVGFLLDIFK